MTVTGLGANAGKNDKDTIVVKAGETVEKISETIAISLMIY